MTHEATVASLTEVFDDWTAALNGDIDKFWTYFDYNGMVSISYDRGTGITRDTTG